MAKSNRKKSTEINQFRESAYESDKAGIKERIGNLRLDFNGIAEWEEHMMRRPYNGEKLLCLHIILRALKDLKDGPPQYKLTAEKWFRDNENNAPGFRWAARAIEIKSELVDELRKKILANEFELDTNVFRLIY